VVNARRTRWSRAADALCQCSQRTRGELRGLERVATGGLERVALDERRVLEGLCDDLRAAVDRRGVLDELRGRPLRVTVGTAHRDASRALEGALDALCGDMQGAFWQRLAARVEAPGADDPRVVLEARRHLQLQRAHCARRAHLARRPAGYVLTMPEALAQGATCGRGARR
jgi:hypothetical protein